MRIFLSYSSADRDRAEPIGLALQARGHDVFFDREDLKGGEDYNAVIRTRIAGADLFIFLISPGSVREGAYTLTELRFARERWRNPRKRVLPVLLEPTPLDSVPAYLRSVTLFEPQGNVAAEVTDLIGQWARWPRRVRPAAAAIGVLAVAFAGYRLLNPADADGWTNRIEASDFVSRFVYPEDAIERVEYVLDPTMTIAAEGDSLVRITRVAYGSLADTAAAMSVTLRFRNVTGAPLAMDFDHRFFTLDDDQGRKAELLYFCCVTGAELLSPAAEREMQLVFAAHAGWSGKETQARRISFRVSGLLPLTSGVWQVPALATATRP